MPYLSGLKKIHIPVWIYALLATLFWGMSFIWTSILLKDYEPVTIIFIRLIISTLFLFSVMFLTRSFTLIRRKDLLLLAASSVMNPFLYFLMENYGLKYSSPAIAAVIISTIPVFSPIPAYFIFKERLTWYNFAGIAISFAGILLMLIAPGFSFASNPLGILFLFGAVVSALIYSVTLKKLSAGYSPLTIISWQNLTGILLFLPFFLVFELKKTLAVPLTYDIISSFLFLALLASSLAYVFFVKSVKALGITKANIFANLIPIVTAVFSFILLGEVFTIRKVAGILVVIAGVLLSEAGKRKG